MGNIFSELGIVLEQNRVPVLLNLYSSEDRLTVNIVSTYNDRFIVSLNKGVNCSRVNGFTSVKVVVGTVVLNSDHCKVDICTKA